MSAPQDENHEEDLKPTNTAGYKVGEKKTVDEYAKLDADDEALNRWKASLGVGASSAGGGPKVAVESLFLTSETLPAGKTVSLKLDDSASLEHAKKNPIVIKEGIEYNVGIIITIQNALVSGLRYIHIVKRAGVKVDKLEHMIGSYGPSPTPHTITFATEESPSGLLARSGSYSVRSRVVDDDGTVYADFEWSFKLAKEW